MGGKADKVTCGTAHYLRLKAGTVCFSGALVRVREGKFGQWRVGKRAGALELERTGTAAATGQHPAKVRLRVRIGGAVAGIPRSSRQPPSQSWVTDKSHAARAIDPDKGLSASAGKFSRLQTCAEECIVRGPRHSPVRPWQGDGRNGLRDPKPRCPTWNGSGLSGGCPKRGLRIPSHRDQRWSNPGPSAAESLRPDSVNLRRERRSHRGRRSQGTFSVQRVPSQESAARGPRGGP